MQSAAKGIHMEKNMFPVDREMFVDIITRYQKTIDIIETVYGLYENNPRLFVYNGSVWPSSMDDIVVLLDTVFGLEEDEWGNTILDYWIREQDFGRKESNDYEYSFKGTKLPAGYTAGDIYDLICQTESKTVLQ